MEGIRISVNEKFQDVKIYCDVQDHSISEFIT